MRSVNALTLRNEYGNSYIANNFIINIFLITHLFVMRTSNKFSASSNHFKNINLLVDFTNN